MHKFIAPGEVFFAAVSEDEVLHTALVLVLAERHAEHISAQELAEFFGFLFFTNFLAGVLMSEQDINIHIPRISAAEALSISTKMIILGVGHKAIFRVQG